MGSALALGCGGLSDGAEIEHEATGGTGAGGGGGGGAGAQGTAAAGGATGTTGGVGGAAGAPLIALNGGTGGSSSVVTPSAGMGGMGHMGPPADCTPAQWSCSDFGVCYRDGYGTPGGCECADTRPKSQQDCAATESYVCRLQRYDAASLPLIEPIPFECACVPKQMSCETACQATFGHDVHCSDGGPPSTDAFFCGCAFIFLR
jgi:hypothetical protein